MTKVCGEPKESVVAARRDRAVGGEKFEGRHPTPAESRLADVVGDRRFVLPLLSN